MIRTDEEYREAVARVAAEEERIAAQKKQLKGMGLKAKEIKRATDPMVSFHLQLVEEVESYERLKRGDFGELTNFEGIGRLIIAVRVYLGMSQRELAEKLDVDASQVSRDERQEYHGITVSRATHILAVLGVQLKTEITLPKAA